MTWQTKIFHSFHPESRNHVHVILVRPENSQNVGAVARALANMGLNGSMMIIGDSSVIDSSSLKLAKHAAPRLNAAIFFPTLREALATFKRDLKPLVLAATARTGSPHRPHPLPIHRAVTEAVARLTSGLNSDLVYVFGPESDGLVNDEVLECDWVVTIPTSEEYRSLNLAQAVLIFAYETNLCLMEEKQDSEKASEAERIRLVGRLVGFAETVGFVLPGDPLKMKPRLEKIFSSLPADPRSVRTIYGLVEQSLRSMGKGAVDYKGRFRQMALDSELKQRR